MAVRHNLQPLLPPWKARMRPTHQRETKLKERGGGGGRPVACRADWLAWSGRIGWVDHIYIILLVVGWGHQIHHASRTVGREVGLLDSPSGVIPPWLGMRGSFCFVILNVKFSMGTTATTTHLSLDIMFLYLCLNPSCYSSRISKERWIMSRLRSVVSFLVGALLLVPGQQSCFYLLKNSIHDFHQPLTVHILRFWCTDGCYKTLLVLQVEVYKLRE